MHYCDYSFASSCTEIIKTLYPHDRQVVMIRVSFDPFDHLSLTVLESVHDRICITINVQLDDLSAFIKVCNIVYLAILIGVRVYDIFTCPHRLRPQLNGYGKRDKKRESVVHE